MSPSVKPPAPGIRWRVTITEIPSDGDEDAFIGFEGDAYIVAVANRTATGLTTDMDHDGDITLRQRLIAHLAMHIDASQRQLFTHRAPGLTTKRTLDRTSNT